MPSLRAPNNRLFIGSLPYKYTEGELLALFVPFGRIIAVRIMRNRWGKSRGLGFVEFDQLQSAIDAKTKLHGFKLVDRSIIVDYAEPDPFNTPEGQARHQEKVDRHLARHPQPSTDDATPSALPLAPKPFVRRRSPVDKPVYHTSPKKFFTPQRQSVYDSRAHHSKVGAKFAAKTRHKP